PSAPPSLMKWNTGSAPLSKRARLSATGNIKTVSMSMPNPTNVTPKPSLNISRSEEHTSELQSRFDLVCRLLLEKKKKKKAMIQAKYDKMKIHNTVKGHKQRRERDKTPEKDMEEKDRMEMMQYKHMYSTQSYHMR